MTTTADLTAQSAPPEAVAAPPRLSVIMPCLNEAETVAICVHKALAAMADLGLAGEVLVADNGSTDGSQDLARQAGARVVDVAEKGYGAALRGGMSAAEGDWLLFADADDSYDFTDIAPFVQALDEGADFVMGCRFPAGGGTIMPGAMPPLHRYLGTPVISWIGRTFYRIGVTDFNCGMRALTKETFHRMGLRSAGMELASEMIVKAAHHDVRLREVPITLHPAGRSRAPHLRSFRDGWRHLRFLLMYSPRWLFLYPSLALLALGLGLGGRLLAGPLHVGGVTFDINTLMVCGMMVLLGLQALSFGIFARVYATDTGVRPASSAYDRIIRHGSLEPWLIGGALIAVAGMGLLVGGVFHWGAHDFGVLDPGRAVRIVLSAVTLIVAGMQILFSSFFLGILRHPHKG